jgi:hypothetical protein
MVKTFIQWAEDKKYDLSFLLTEKGSRTGLHYPMPTGYYMAHYPRKYFNPIIATADQDVDNFKQYKDKAPPDDAP